MGRSQETFNKKEVRTRKEKKRKDKEKKRLARRENEKNSLDDMIAYVDENGNISSTPPNPDKKEDIDPDNIQIQTPKSGDVGKDDILRTGVLTYFDESKGYGFIKDDLTDDKIFVHISNFIDDIKQGDKITFENELGHKGIVAVNVKILK